MAVFSTFRVPVDVVGRSRRRRLTRRILLADLRSVAAMDSGEPCTDCSRDEQVRNALATARARRSTVPFQTPRWY